MANKTKQRKRLARVLKQRARDIKKTEEEKVQRAFRNIFVKAGVVK